jgi:hypothetical protein
MTFSEIINEWAGRQVGDGECVIWAAQFACEAYGVCYLPTPSTGGARDIYEVFAEPLPQYFIRVPNTPEAVPPQGALIIWGEGLGNYYGHIGIVESADTNGFNSWDSNWSGRTVQKIYHNYNNVIGWLIPKGGSMQLRDSGGYQLGVTVKTFAHLSSPDEANAVGVNLNDIRVLYGNNFIQIKGRPELYQWVTSEEALRLISEGGTPKITVIETDAQTVAKLQARITELEKQIAEMPSADAVAKDTNSKVSDIWNWIKSIFNR